MSARILVVDDLEPNIKLLEVKLTNQYYEVLTAKNGLEAIEILTTREIDIILLDVMMPGMDGFEVCRRIRENPKTAHIPVVMVTALGDVEDRIRGLNAGADDFISKPIVDIALFARIRSLVRLKALIDEIRNEGEAGIQFVVSRNEEQHNLIELANILLVDDDITQINFLQDTLNIAKITVADVNNPIDQYLHENLDLIIVSTQLMKLDSLRICATILNNHNTRNLPIIMLVEEGDHLTMVKGLDLGVSDYVTIPLNQEEVKARVKTQIRRKKFQDALKNNLLYNINLASIDSLTGLYNRHYFNSQISIITNSTRKSEPTSLIIIDIDFFKKINDTHGHLAGDKILKQVANITKAAIRTNDILARFGGEEFILLLPNANLEQAYLIAERIRKNIEKETNITVSLGITTLKEIDSIENLIDRADKALYLAKQQGRNRSIKIE